MRIGRSSRKLWSITLPLIVVGVAETIVDLIDLIFLGHFGVAELGAIGMADTIYGLLIVAILGLGDGMQVLVARRVGRGNPRAVGRAFNQGVMILLVASLAIFGAIRWGTPLFTAGFESDEVRDAVNTFLRIAAFGVLFDALNLAWGIFYVSIGRTRVFIGSVAVLAVTNTVLDYALIFGNLGAPRLGIAGAAIASVAAEAASFAFITLYAWRAGDLRRYGLLRLRGWSRPLAWRLARISLPVVVEGLVEAARWFLFFAIIERLGETTLASASVIYMCYEVLLIPAVAFAETACSLAGRLVGAGRAERIGGLLRKATWFGYVATVPFLLATAVFPREVLGILTAEQAAIDGGVNGLFVVVAALLVGIPGEILLGALLGTGDTRGVLLIEVAATACILLLSWAAALVMGLPLEFIWATIVVGWLVRILMALARLRSRAWTRVRI